MTRSVVKHSARISVAFGGPTAANAVAGIVKVIAMATVTAKGRSVASNETAMKQYVLCMC